MKKTALDYQGHENEAFLQIGFADPLFCTGCMLCKSICPTGAISERRDSLGFIYPEIIADKCVGCKLCEQACESLGTLPFNGEQRYYSAINKSLDVLNNSASGGTFYELAAAMIAKKGSVYGAAYQNGFLISHERADSPEGVKRLMGTKYTQSNIENMYSVVAEDLSGGTSVLFAGTPCQCDALRVYLACKKISTDKLYLCDLFCHGVFSPQIWQEYIEYLQNRFKDNITYVSFRDKKKCWRNNSLKILPSSQDISRYCNNNASVLKLYAQNISFRDSCYRCKYMNFNRVGDISIGDFWGIERIRPNVDSNKGVSAIIVNTKKGRELFDIISKNMTVEEFEQSDISQQVLKEPTPMNPRRSEFIADYQSGGIERIVFKYGRIRGWSYIKRNVLAPLLSNLKLYKILRRKTLKTAQKQH